jgi:hypothetical protein
VPIHNTKICLSDQHGVLSTTLVKLGVRMFLDWTLNGFGNSGCFFLGLRRSIFGHYFFMVKMPPALQ